MIEFRQRRVLEQDLMPEAIKYLKQQGTPHTVITPDKADEASRVNSKSLVLVSFKRNTSGYYEIQVKDKEFYRYDRKLLESTCGMRITGADEKARTYTAEDDHLGKVLRVIELLGWEKTLSVVKS